MNSIRKPLVGLFSVAIVCILVAACQKELVNDMSRYSLHKELSLINEEYNKSKSAVDKEGILFTSEVKLVKEDDSFVLYVNDEERDAKRKFKLSFLPSMDMSLPANHIDKAEILYIRHFLVVNPLNKQEVYVFTLANEDLTLVVDKFKENVTKIVNVYSGYGLTQHKSKLEDLGGK